MCDRGDCQRGHGDGDENELAAPAVKTGLHPNDDHQDGQAALSVLLSLRQTCFEYRRDTFASTLLTVIIVPGETVSVRTT